MIKNIKSALLKYFSDGKVFEHKEIIQVAPLAELLPWRIFDEKEGVFVNDKSIGVVIEFNPLSGQMIAEDEERLSKLFSNGLEDRMTIQFYRWEHPHSGYWVNKMNEANKGSKNKIIKKIFSERFNHLKGSNKDSLFDNFSFYMRNTQCFVAISMPYNIDNQKSIISKLKKSRTHFIENFKSLSGFAVNYTPTDFINMIEQWLHPSFDLTRKLKKYDGLTPINQQIYNGNNTTSIFPNAILLESLVASPLLVQELPDQWSASLTPLLNGDEHNDYARVTCPTLTVLNITALNSNNSKAHAHSRRRTLQSQVSEGFVTKRLPILKREHDEWAYVANRVDDDDKLVKANQYVIAFDTPERIENSVASITSIYNERGWVINFEKYGNFPSFLYCLPFMPSEGMYEDFLRLGKLKTRLTSTCASLCNFYANSKGYTAELGILLQGRHGQPFFWNPFISDTNYNISIVGVPGAGKSVLMQDIVSFVLSCQKGTGEVIVIDDGYSFKNSCLLLGGEHIVMQGEISINPFSND